jgi:hypothetical protein
MSIEKMRIESVAPVRVDLAGGTVDIWPLYLLGWKIIPKSCRPSFPDITERGFIPGKVGWFTPTTGNGARRRS